MTRGYYVRIGATGRSKKVWLQIKRGSNMVISEIVEYLQELTDRFNTPTFIDDDPISIPHCFQERKDQEIAGFFASTIAWGNRQLIVRNGKRLMSLMGNEPFRFTMEASNQELLQIARFTHRTFNGTDCLCFLSALRHLYQHHGGIGTFFESGYALHGDLRIVISRFRQCFFSISHPSRSEKHLSSIDKRAACKRINMFLRWMVRRDKRGVDLGLWKRIPPSALFLPLDIHTARTSRILGLLKRKQNDWKAVEEITDTLRNIDSEDPVRFDFALFGAGIHGLL